MSIRAAYTYATLRYVHDMATGEFVNVGVVLYSAADRYVGAIFTDSPNRVAAMFPGINFRSLLRQFSNIQAGAQLLNNRLKGDAGAERFKTVEQVLRELLPRDDSSLQWGAISSGVSSSPKETLLALYRRLVARYQDAISVSRGQVMVDFALSHQHQFRVGPKRQNVVRLAHAPTQIGLAYDLRRPGIVSEAIHDTVIAREKREQLPPPYGFST